MGTRSSSIAPNRRTRPKTQARRPPKARRKKTDRIDTARIQREYLNGEMPLAYQPPVELRQLRRLTAQGEDIPLQTLGNQPDGAVLVDQSAS